MILFTATIQQCSFQGKDSGSWKEQGQKECSKYVLKVKQCTWWISKLYNKSTRLSTNLEMQCGKECWQYKVKLYWQWSHVHYAIVSFDIMNQTSGRKTCHPRYGGGEGGNRTSLVAFCMYIILTTRGGKEKRQNKMLRFHKVFSLHLSLWQVVMLFLSFPYLVWAFNLLKKHKVSV